VIFAYQFPLTKPFLHLTLRSSAVGWSGGEVRIPTLCDAACWDSLRLCGGSVSLSSHLLKGMRRP
jgi:hypothetical protein